MTGEALHPDLVEVLCCPACRGDLEHRPERAELACGPCGFTYPIVDGIPVLFPMDVKARFEELFGRYWDSEERADTYDQFVEGRQSRMDMHHHVGELRATLEVLGPLEGGTLLDCGCGNGRFFEQYPADVRAFGIDASLNLLRICKQKGRCDRLVCGELEHLPFKTGRFDRAVSVRVLQHIRRQREAVEEMVRAVRGGGEIVIHCYNDASTKALAKRLRESRWQRVANAPFRTLFRTLSPFPPWGIEYDRYSTVPQIARWLRESGAQVERVRGSGFGFNKWLVDGFMLAPALEKRAPRVLDAYLAASLRAEERLGRRRPFSYVMEKFVVKAVKRGLKDTVASD